MRPCRMLQDLSCAAELGQFRDITITQLRFLIRQERERERERRYTAVDGTRDRV